MTSYYGWAEEAAGISDAERNRQWDAFMKREAPVVAPALPAPVPALDDPLVATINAALPRPWRDPLALQVDDSQPGCDCPSYQMQDETTYECRNMERCARRAALVFSTNGVERHVMPATGPWRRNTTPVACGHAEVVPGCGECEP